MSVRCEAAAAKVRKPSFVTQDLLPELDRKTERLKTAFI